MAPYLYSSAIFSLLNRPPVACCVPKHAGPSLEGERIFQIKLTAVAELTKLFVVTNPISSLVCNHFRVGLSLKAGVPPMNQATQLIFWLWEMPFGLVAGVRLPVGTNNAGVSTSSRAETFISFVSFLGIGKLRGSQCLRGC